MITDVLPVVLYVLGSILIIVLIILGIKLIITMNKIEDVVDDINKKVKSLNGLFSIVDATTDKLALQLVHFSFTSFFIIIPFNKQ